jgi:conjugal transfer pilus assembly protein TraE
MTPSEMIKRNQLTVRQRNIAMVSAAMLGASTLALSFVVAARSERTILVPTLTGPASVSTGQVSAEYLEAMTRDVANLMLNRQPDQGEYFERELLRVTDPATHGEFRRTMTEDRERAAKSNTSTVFYPREIKTWPGKSQSSVRGVLDTMVGETRVESAEKTYVLAWKVSGTQVLLRSFLPAAEGDNPGVGQ